MATRERGDLSSLLTLNNSLPQEEEARGVEREREREEGEARRGALEAEIHRSRPPLQLRAN